VARGQLVILPSVLREALPPGRRVVAPVEVEGMPHPVALRRVTATSIGWSPRPAGPARACGSSWAVALPLGLA